MKKLLFIIFLLFFYTDVFSAGVTFTGVTLTRTKTGNDIMLMCIGDSVTVGTGSTEGTGYRKYLYPLTTRLYSFVGMFGDNTYFYNRHDGVGGEIIADVKARLDADLDSVFPTASLVGDKSAILMHIGTNDIGLGEVLSPVATRVQNILDMIDMINTHNASIDIYIALIIPPQTGQAETITFNTALNTALITKQTSISNLYIVDIYTTFVSNANWSTEYMDSNLHPNDAGYNVMAIEWANDLNSN